MTDDSTLDAFRIRRDDSGFEAGRRTLTLDQLTDGDVVVDVAHSSINYKDALAGTGRGRILRRPELNGGIDLAGRVVRSDNDAFEAGDEVFVCGGGLSETLDGGYATRTRVPANILLRPPPGLSLRDTMAIGTAGITAAIALRRLLDNAQPVDRGPIVVTGASGGVGSFAIHLLARAGFEVLASSGKHDSHDYLHALGAHKVIGRLGESGGTKPLESVRYGGAIDSVGGDTLAHLAATTAPWGSIACVGLAGGTDLNTTVMPLILRGVSLLGINCLELPDTMLDDCWTHLAGDWKPTMLDAIAPHETGLNGLPAAFDAIMASSVTGRYVVTL